MKPSSAHGSPAPPRREVVHGLEERSPQGFSFSEGLLALGSFFWTISHTPLFAQIALKNQEAKREKTEGPTSSDSTEPSTAPVKHSPVLESPRRWAAEA